MMQVAVQELPGILIYLMLIWVVSSVLLEPSISYTLNCMAHQLMVNSIRTCLRQSVKVSLKPRNIQHQHLHPHRHQYVGHVGKLDVAVPRIIYSVEDARSLNYIVAVLRKRVAAGRKQVHVMTRIATVAIALAQVR